MDALREYVYAHFEHVLRSSLFHVRIFKVARLQAAIV